MADCYSERHDFNLIPVKLETAKQVPYKAAMVTCCHSALSSLLSLLALREKRRYPSLYVLFKVVPYPLLAERVAGERERKKSPLKQKGRGRGCHVGALQKTRKSLYCPFVLQFQYFSSLSTTLSFSPLSLCQLNRYSLFLSPYLSFLLHLHYSLFFFFFQGANSRHIQSGALWAAGQIYSLHKTPLEGSIFYREKLLHNSLHKTRDK